MSTNISLLADLATYSSNLTTIAITGGGGGASVTTSANAPSTPSTGDLWYKTTDSSLNVYENSVWNRVGGSTTIRTVETFTATANQTTFTPSTNYSYVDVYKNNVRVPTNQYTATNGVNIVLATGATANDVIEIYAYATIGGTAQGTGGLSIVSVVVTDVSGTPLGYAGFAEVGGGYVKITGTGFSSGISATIGGTAALSTVYNSPTEVIVRVPPKSYGSYGITLTDLLGFTVSLTNAVIYYPAATWVTNNSLPDIAMDIPVSIQLQAVGGTAFALAGASTLPAGLTLNTVSGLISGTLTVFSGDSFSTSFVVNVTNNVGVTTSRTFTLFANAARYETAVIEGSTAINRYWIFENPGVLHRFDPPHFGNYDILLVGGGGSGGSPGGGGGAGGVAEKLNTILNSTSSVYYRKVSQISIISGGTGYVSAPTVVITPVTGNIPTIAATATATISGGAITSISVTNNGSGYTSAPLISFTGGSGTGATATAVLGGNTIKEINVGAGGVNSSGGNTKITKNALPVEWIGYGGGKGGNGGAAGSSGGSGGGAGTSSSNQSAGGSATQPGSVTGGYGNAGGNGYDGGATTKGGGGGANTAGGNWTTAGAPGAGRLMTGWEIRGTNANNTLIGIRGYYGGGGGSADAITNAVGGGGSGSTAGIAKTGGGGGGSSANGGSGILIIKQKYGYDADILLAGGGGSGGTNSSGGNKGGGGGAGALVYTINNQFNVLPGETYTATIGGGGSNSTLAHANYTLTAYAGGVGGTGTATGNPGGSGGGGGGWQNNGTSGGASTQESNVGYGHGHNGGPGGVPNASIGGGGGGAGGVGGVGTGGVGITWLNGNTYCTGGPGDAVAAGAVNTGNGGSTSASGAGNSPGTAGGSGIFIIRYAGPQRGSGGTITSVDGYTYHTFTTSGVFTG